MPDFGHRSSPQPEPASLFRSRLGRLKCRLGMHDHRVTAHRERPGYGFFGGTMFFWDWTCRRCGKLGVTVG